MAGLLQAAQRHQLYQVADVHAAGRAVKTDIGGDPFLAEESIEILWRRAVMIGAAFEERAEEFGAE